MPKIDIDNQSISSLVELLAKLVPEEELLGLFQEQYGTTVKPSGLLDGYGPMLSADDVSELTGVSLKTVYALLASGEIPGRKVGRTWLIARDNFEDYLHGRVKNK